MAEAPTWRTLLTRAAATLGDDADARRDARLIVEEASGHSSAELVVHGDDRCTALTHARWAAMVERRANGEPLQYVLGHWSFRKLDLMVDARVLIPRPETEVVGSCALDEVDRLGATTIADLGTGSGAIALSVAAERPDLDVWATDSSAPALDVARANLAGLGRAGRRVRMAMGDWFEALPLELRGALDVVVSNPPYVADGDPLPDDVARWEPAAALYAGPDGLSAVTRIVREAPTWLRPNGSLVLEIGETQSDAVRAELERAGFAASIAQDLTGRDRVAIGRLASSS